MARFGISCPAWRGLLIALAVLNDAVMGQSPTGTPFTAAPTTSDTTNTWTGCVYDRKEGGVAIGKLTTVCMQIGGGTVNWANGLRYTRQSFRPEGDQYSRFHIPNSYRDLVSNNANSALSGPITISVASQLQLSFLKLYYASASQRVFPYLTAIIDVNKGVVEGITWDNACVFCNQDVCQENTYDYNGNLVSQSTAGIPTGGCYVTIEECNKAIGDGNTMCDLTLYVVWTGTDVNGIALQSSAFRFSQFQVQQLTDQLAANLPSPSSVLRQLHEAGNITAIKLHAVAGDL